MRRIHRRATNEHLRASSTNTELIGLDSWGNAVRKFERGAESFLENPISINYIDRAH